MSVLLTDYNESIIKLALAINVLLISYHTKLLAQCQYFLVNALLTIG